MKKLSQFIGLLGAFSSVFLSVVSFTEWSLADERIHGPSAPDARPRLMAFGESKQGSSLLHGIQVQMIQTLISENGYRGIILEDSNSALEPVREYLVSDCSASAEAVINASWMKTFWKSSSLAGLLTWICRYNQKALLSPVLVYGIDGFEVEWAGKELLKAKSGKIQASSFAKTGCLLDSALDSVDADVEAIFKAYVTNGTASSDKAALLTCQTRLRSLLPTFSTTKEPERVRAVRTALFFYDHLRYFRSNVLQAYAARDRLMFENTEDLLRRSLARKRVIFWGHLSHLLRGPGDPEANNFGVQTLGYFLGKRYGKDYEVMGVLAPKETDGWAFSAETVDKFKALLGKDKRKVFPANRPELAPFPWRNNLDLLMVVDS